MPPKLFNKWGTLRQMSPLSTPLTVPDIICVHTMSSFPEGSLIIVCYALPQLHKEKK